LVRTEIIEEEEKDKETEMTRALLILCRAIFNAY
jgi:hypothetical protein